MEPLSAWLCLIGLLRLWSAYMGFFSIWGLRTAVFSKTSMTEVHGRTFGTWTLVSCTLCFMCAADLENKGLYTATLISFLYVLLHFSTEFFIYKTMSLANFSGTGTIACTSALWMSIRMLSKQ